MRMIPGIKEAFDKISAEDELKARTRAFLAKKTNNYTEYRVPNVQRLAAAAACFLCLLAGSYWLYFVPTAEISIDINPSIELGINRFDQVISVRGRTPRQSIGRWKAKKLSLCCPMMKW